MIIPMIIDIIPHGKVRQPKIKNPTANANAFALPELCAFCGAAFFAIPAGRFSTVNSGPGNSYCPGDTAFSNRHAGALFAYAEAGAAFAQIDACAAAKVNTFTKP